MQNLLYTRAKRLESVLYRRAEVPGSHRKRAGRSESIRNRACGPGSLCRKADDLGSLSKQANGPGSLRRRAGGTWGFIDLWLDQFDFIGELLISLIDKR